MNPQSPGEVTLRSNDPRNEPVIDPHYLEHSFDSKVMLQLICETIRLQRENTGIRRWFKGVWYGLKSSSDEGVLEFFKEAVQPT